jgi:hypothetical protein
MIRTAWLAPLVLCLASPALAQYPIRTQLRNVSEAAIANPPCAPRDFAGNRARHRLIVGMIGGGIDYNQPFLADQLAFDLDAEGRPLGLGIDFIGDDRWPSQRVLSTARYLFAERPASIQREILETNSIEKFDEAVRSEYAGWDCVAKQVISDVPEAGEYHPLYRHLGYENQQADLTETAGMLAAGKPEIGIIPYRVFPYARTREEMRLQTIGQQYVNVDQFKKAVEHASGAGARILFVSWTDFVSRPDDLGSDSARNELKRVDRMKRMVADEYLKVMRAHPKMLFVTKPAAGHGWTDDSSLIQFPCGLPARNLVCVAPLTERKAIDPRYKVPVNEDARLLFAELGDKRTLFDSDTCQPLFQLIDSLIISADEQPGPNGGACWYNEFSDVWEAEPLKDAQKATVRELLRACRLKTSWFGEFRRMDTSQAVAAQVTRAIASFWLENPGLTMGEEVLDAYFAKNASCERTGAIVQCRTTGKWPQWVDFLDRLR